MKKVYNPTFIKRKSGKLCQYQAKQTLELRKLSRKKKNISNHETNNSSRYTALLNVYVLNKIYAPKYVK